jgi:hypothetical protein
MTPARSILLGGLISGTIDFFYATGKRLNAGGSVEALWKGVASGLLGQTARDGGLGMAILGVVLHFTICLGAAVVFYLIARKVSFVKKQWLLSAVLFGFAFLLVMNYVILPLSQIGRPIYVGEGFAWAILGHILMIGFPIAFFASRNKGDIPN